MGYICNGALSGPGDFPRSSVGLSRPHPNVESTYWQQPRDRNSSSRWARPLVEVVVGSPSSKEAGSPNKSSTLIPSSIIIGIIYNTLRRSRFSHSSVGDNCINRCLYLGSPVFVVVLLLLVTKPAGNKERESTRDTVTAIAINQYSHPQPWTRDIQNKHAPPCRTAMDTAVLLPSRCWTRPADSASRGVRCLRIPANAANRLSAIISSFLRTFITI